MGANGKPTNEAVQGDMGWTNFEAREAQSKIDFEERLRKMEESRWDARAFRYLYRQNIDSQWRKRTRKLTSKYATGMASNMATKNVKRKGREAKTRLWVAAMEKKPAMTNYLKGKREVRK